jgi:hypothetical protein
MYRAALVRERDEGLTKMYNRFHDFDEDNDEIAQLRDLHGAMDRAALATRDKLPGARASATQGHRK